MGRSRFSPADSISAYAARRRRETARRCTVNPRGATALIHQRADMYDVLVYVYEHCQQGEIAQDRARVARKLAAAGFDHSDVDQALHWLDGMRRPLQESARPLPDAVGSFRAYSPREMAKFD